MKLCLSALFIACALMFLPGCQPHDAGRGKPEVTGTATR